jgi:hypothetical protein
MRTSRGNSQVYSLHGDAHLGYRHDLRRFDLAIIPIHPERLVVQQIKESIPAAVSVLATAPRHTVTTIGQPVRRRRR